MRFSIVITTYNRLPLLKRALASAINQSIPCEVIVVDDCSSDGTEAYVRSLGEQIVYLRNAVNMGHSASINVGVRAAQGDWIKLVDDDDYLAPTCVEEMMQAIALRPQSVICSCQSIQVDVDEREIKRTRRHGPGRVFYIPQEDIHYGMLLEQVPFGTPIQVAFQQEAFLQSGGWDSSLDLNCDDIDSWIRIAQFGDALFINRCLVYRTIWTGARNQQVSLQRRLESNLLMKRKIHERVNPSYQAKLPSLASIKQYLRLHWGLAALKQKNVASAIALSAPALLSLPAWRLLMLAMRSRRNSDKLSDVRKIVLLET